MDSKAAQQVSTGGSNLKSLAENGQFAVNEAGFQAYIKACDFFIDGYDKMLREVEILADAARMGGSRYAEKVAQFNATTINGDPEALIPNLLLMKQGVEDAREAMVIARKNYRETENAHTVAFTELNKNLQDQ
ncbi:hypothetical protein [Amycolatopsis nalaikhensis]|uniref:Uncharacterized protein n=1 Tax=Amycolatopsis nalaikhensis TaxID=715472 RepID=A0ABY8XXX0_9PSEU|nr:hypothetical protein [Amycolatopsis sp. 2-2]WIV60438.1 hypothetical protein QP939_18415 [Amycolatopsis sp. 2-2]